VSTMNEVLNYIVDHLDDRGQDILGFKRHRRGLPHPDAEQAPAAEQAPVEVNVPPSLR